MRDYALLIKALRYCGDGEANNYDCTGCPAFSFCKGLDSKTNICFECADAFEELLTMVKEEAF